MREAAATLLEALSPDEVAAATRELADERERTNWHYIPKPRQGLSLRKMSHAQRRLVFRLLASGLSLGGYAKVTAIVALESVLEELEEVAHFDRDPALYFLTLFGSPFDEQWSWRFEGHHVSVNITVAGTEASAAPMFLGANPAEVVQDGVHVLRPLAAEDDLARELLCSLDDGQRERVVISPNAPDDILTTNLPSASDVVLDGGLPAGQMREEQRELVSRLVRVYVDRAAPGLAAAHMARIAEAGIDSLRFAWAGSPERRRPHYYRLHGPAFLAEYDNTQDGANHIHAVWRDPADDFGEDLLRSHLARDH
jgi:hypothetical protein